MAVDFMEAPADIRLEGHTASSPPIRSSGWVLGLTSVASFMVALDATEGRFRLMPTGANGQPAFVHYSRGPHGAAFEAHGVQVLTLQDDAIAALTVFRDPMLAARFGFPLSVPGA
jgi:RNA polymerase sigma-70 factor, ECF subfamily